MLKDNPNLISIFICGNQQFKLMRVMDKLGVDAEKAIEEIKASTVPERITTTTTARRSGAMRAAMT